MSRIANERKIQRLYGLHGLQGREIVQELICRHGIACFTDAAIADLAALQIAEHDGGTPPALPR